MLGFKITRDRNAKLLYLDQKYYLEKVLKKFKMAKSKVLSTLVSQGTVLSKNMCPKDKEEQEFMENVPYAQAVGSLMYATTSIRPYICHKIWLVSIYQFNLGRAYWQEVKRNFRYLQGTKSMKLCFGISDLEIIRYRDADFARDVDDKNLLVVMYSYLVEQLSLG